MGYIMTWDQFKKTVDKKLEDVGSYGDIELEGIYITRKTSLVEINVFMVAPGKLKID